jgi:catalase
MNFKTNYGGDPN